MPDITDLTYFTVVRTVSPVPAGALTADVVFEAQVTRGLAVQADVSPDVIEVLVRPVTARIVNGVLMKDGTPGVSLLSAAEVAIEGGFSYTATFKNERLDGKPLPVRDALKDLTFAALGAAGTFDLKDAAPIVASTAVPTARGPKGDKGDTGPAGPTGPTASWSTITGKPAVVAAGADAAAARSAIGTLGAQTATSHAPALGLYFPEAEGALGDDSHDDTAAINAAIAAAPAGSQIRLAAGKKYKISAPINFAAKTNVTFDAVGAWVRMVGTGSGYGAFEMTGACTGVHIRNVRVSGTANIADQHLGVWIHDSASNVVTDCSVTNSRFYDLCDGVSVNLTTAGGTLNGWLVEGCHVENMVGTDPGFGYGIHVSAGTQSYSTGVRIVNNHIRGAQRHSIYHANGEGSVIANNTIRDHRAGVATGDVRPAINVTRSRDVNVTGNNVDGFSDGALIVACESGALDGCVVSGNLFSDPANTVAMVVVGDPVTPNAQTRNVTLVGNTFKSTSTGRMLLIRSATNLLVGNNLFNLSNASGGSVIELSGSSDTSGTATYNDNIVLRGNLLVIEGGGTGYGFRLSGIETSTARLVFEKNTVVGATATFIASVAASNPNIIVDGAADGLSFATNVGFDFSRGSGAMFLPNRSATPSFSISGGAFLWAQSGAIRGHSTNATPTLVGNITTASANYTVLVSDAVILATGGASGITITLPAATSGLRYVIKKVDSGAGAITVATTSSQTIDGLTTKTLPYQYDSLEVVGDGSKWQIVASGTVPAGRVLARTVYAPGTRQTYTTTSTTFAAVDATNLSVSFVAPPSGKAVVRLAATVFTSASGFISWALLDHTTAAQVGVSGAVAGTTQVGRPTMEVDITGLTPGTTYTYDWAWAVSGALTGSMYAGAQTSPAQGNGAAVMTVLSA